MNGFEGGWQTMRDSIAPRSTRRRYLTVLYRTDDCEMNSGPGYVTLEGVFDLVVRDLDDIVQVAFPPSTYPYAYRDPSGRLRVGDLVQVAVHDTEAATGVGRVVALGRGAWPGGEVKNITGKLEVRPL